MKEQNGKRCCADKSQGRRQSPSSSGGSLIPGSRRREAKAETQDQKESVMGEWLGSQVIYLDSLGTIKDPMFDLSKLLWKKEYPGQVLVHLIVCLSLLSPQVQSRDWNHPNHGRILSPELNLESPALQNSKKVSQTLYSFTYSFNKHQGQLHAINDVQQTFGLTKDGCESRSSNNDTH